ncbi:MAG: site-specific integrase [Aestuariivirga sp.]
MNRILHISKRQVDALVPTERDLDFFDDDLKGFGVRVRTSGRKTYFVLMRHRGVLRRFTIGAHGAVSPELARNKAKGIIAQLAIGNNPSEAKDAIRRSISVRALADRFMAEYVPFHCKASTPKEYKRCVEIFIVPEIGTTKVISVERTDITALHHRLRNIPYQANWTLGVLSVMFAQAEAWNLREANTNPCRGVKKFKEQKRERFLSLEELNRLGEALRVAELDTPSAITCIRLLILTGCRLSEIQKLKWSYIDLTSKLIHLPDSKSGKKTIYLGQAAVDEFRRTIRVNNNPYVVTGYIDGQHLIDMQKPWRRIRKDADLEDVRIHDLRHTFASHGVAMGQGLPIIGKLLGHTQPQTTARYAHLDADPAIEVADRISERLAKCLNPIGVSQSDAKAA